MKKLAFLLIPLFGLFFTSNSFALKHDYQGFATSSLIRPDPIQDSSHKYYYDWTSGQPFYSQGPSFGGFTNFNPFYVYVPTEHSDNYRGYKPLPYLSVYQDGGSPDYLQFTYSNDSCLVNRYASSPNYRISNEVSTYQGNNTQIHQDGAFNIAGAFSGFTIQTRPWFPDGYIPSTDISPISHPKGTSVRCYSRDYFKQKKFRYDTSGVTSWRYTDLQNVSTVYNWAELFNMPLDNIATSDGLNLRDVQTNSNGVQYNAGFSFSRLFGNTDVPYVRGMRIPLSSYDGYFLKSENVYSGRQFDFYLNLYFPNGVEFNSDLSDGYFYLLLANAVNSQGQMVTEYSGVNLGPKSSPCTITSTNFVNDEGNTATTSELHCSITLDQDYAGFDPYLIIDVGRDDYLFHSLGEWSFGASYLVSDNDYTPGSDFNSGLSGMWSLYDGSDYTEGDADFFASLKNLFNFNVPSQPLGLALGGFTNQESCASIPIIAGMIHSNETEVCPWFSAETRSITTPVLTLFSGFLVFGFIIHWLGSSSGNFLEDSGSHGDGSIKVGKRGK